MKTIATIFLTLIFAQAYCQTDSIRNNNQKKDFEMMTFSGIAHSNGGYGAITTGYSEIDGVPTAEFGCKGAWVIGHNMAFGFYAKGFFSDYNYINDRYITGGHSGLFIEPIIGPRFPVHLSFPINIGFGGITGLNRYFEYEGDDWDTYYSNTDVIFIAEPGVEVELNMTRFFRIGLGASYRYTSNIELSGFENESLQGITGGISLKFGKF